MKQTFTYKIMLAAFALFSAAGCSNDEMDNQPKQPDDTAESSGVEVQFTAGLGAETKTSYTSDGNTDEGFIVEWKGYDTDQTNYDKVGIFVENPDNNTSVAGAKNIPYRPTTSNTSSPLEADGTPLSGLEVGKTYNFYSYYPYDNNQHSSLSSVNILNLKEQTQVAPNDNKHIGRYDFIYAKQEGVTIETGNNPPTVNFQYAHLFTSLQFNLRNGRNAAVKINKITLERQDGNNMEIPNYYNFQAGKAESFTHFGFQHLTITSPTDLSAGATQKFWMMLYPKSIGDATELKISVHLTDGNGVSHLYTLKKAVPTGGFEAGYNYTLEMNVKDTGLSPDTESWTTVIDTKAELEAFRDDVNNNGNTYNGKTVRLSNHINLTDETWTPIGNSNKPFKGTFDGGGYHISNLNVNMNDNFAGLFGNIMHGKVCNLRVSGKVKTTGNYAGGIVGNLYSDGTVENCIFSGEVQGGKYVGGISGDLTGRVKGCYTKGSVIATNSATAFAGGIVGSTNLGTTGIEDCYTEAEVKASGSSAGGIVGYNSGPVTHCYATGKVSGKNRIGGIIGINNSGSVTDCIALNLDLTRTEGYMTDFGRIVGYNSPTVTNCAAFTGMTLPDDITPTDNANGIHGASFTREQCLTATTYTSRDFTTTNGWEFDTSWQSLPWNKAFESFPGISETDYKISVPNHLKQP